MDERPTRSEGPVRTALVGASGLAGRYFHAPHVAVCPQLELVALVQRSAATDAGFPELAPRAVLLHSLEDALRADGVGAELVIIASPDATHAAYAMACLRAGRHVLVDKPLTQTLAEAEAVLGAAADAGGALLCMPYHNRRYDSDFLTVVRLLTEGRLGRLIEYRANYDRFRPVVASSWKEQDRGALDNLGPHLIDQAVFLFGEPAAVSADIATLRAGGVTDDYFELRLHYDGGEGGEAAAGAASLGRVRGVVRPPRAPAVLKSSCLVPDHGPRFALHGDGGSFAKRGLDVQEAALRRGGVVLPRGADWGVEPDADAGVLVAVDAATGAVLPPARVRTEAGAYGRLYSGVAAAVRARRPLAAQDVTPWQALATMRVIDAARRSAAAAGAAVALAPVPGPLADKLRRALGGGDGDA